MARWSQYNRYCLTDWQGIYTKFAAGGAGRRHNMWAARPSLLPLAELCLATLRNAYRSEAIASTNAVDAKFGSRSHVTRSRGRRRRRLEREQPGARNRERRSIGSDSRRTSSKARRTAEQVGKQDSYIRHDRQGFESGGQRKSESENRVGT